MFSNVNSNTTKRRLLLLAFGILVVALCIDLLYRKDHTGVDFHTYLAAGQVGVHQGWSHIYDQARVAAEQKALSPNLRAQPFLSPPLDAFLTVPLGFLPYDVAYVAWAVALLALFAAALAWAGISHGWSKWIAVIGALSPWWVMHAVNVGQVVPIEAAGCLVAWRLLREKREWLAGLALATILFKPNNAILVPFALLFAARFRLFASWAGVALACLVAVFMAVGTQGLTEYVTQLHGRLPAGADYLTLRGGLGATGMFAAVLRIAIVGAVLAAGHRLRESPGLVIPVAIVGSLLISPYLHASDLMMLAVAGFMAWEEKPALLWRAPLIVTWIAASPYMFDLGWSPHLRLWPLFEIALLAALLLATWWPSLTAGVTSRRRAPA